jgi:predicted XRE-type DNA-binding protein
VRSSGNVFADLGIADAGERQTKVRLAMAINEALHRRGLSQEKAAKLLGINQPKVSALSKYRLEGFSVERLMRFLTSLSQDVEITIRNRPRARRPGRVIVTADLTSPRHSSGRSGSLPRSAGPSRNVGASGAPLPPIPG